MFLSALMGSDVPSIGLQGFPKMLMGVAQAGLGAGMGGAQLLKGKMMQKKADKMFPSLNDPQELSILNELRSKQRTFETGAALKPASDAIAKSTQATNRGILKASGGNVGLAIRGMTATQRASAEAENKIYTEAQESVKFYAQMRANAAQMVARRKLQLQLLRYGQAQADARGLQKMGWGNIMGGVGLGMPMGDTGSFVNSLLSGGGTSSGFEGASYTPSTFGGFTGSPGLNPNASGRVQGGGGTENYDALIGAGIGNTA